jgi:hypothetical protein
MTRYLVVLAAAMLVGCTGGDDGKGSDSGGTDTVTGDDDDDSCATTVVGTFPVSGDTDVFFKSDVRFTLSGNDPTATVEVTDGAGGVVAGNTEVIDTLVTWSGDDFVSQTAYTATLTYACGSNQIQFTTSDVGPPTTVDLTGRVYALDLASGDWVKPAGVGTLLASQLGDTQVLVSPTSVGTDTIEMIGAVGSAGNQDLCTPTLPFPPADWADPYFSLSSDLLPLVVADLEINIEDLDLSGGFAPDGGRIQGAALKGIIDTRQIADAFPEIGSTDGAVCELVATFGVACEECTSDGTPYCLSVYIDAIEAGYLSGSSITPRTPVDFGADPFCK